MTSRGWLTGDGEMVKVIQAMDWARTPLGPIESWPQSLRTTVSLVQASTSPISMIWGPGNVQIYNDGSGGVGGLFLPVTDMTGQMLSARRTRTLPEQTVPLEEQTNFADVQHDFAEEQDNFAEEQPVPLHEQNDFARVRSAPLRERPRSFSEQHAPLREQDPSAAE
jgi:hypothetical protein